MQKAVQYDCRLHQESMTESNLLFCLAFTALLKAQPFSVCSSCVALHSTW